MKRVAPAPHELFEAFPAAVRSACVLERRRWRGMDMERDPLDPALADAIVDTLRARHLDPASLAWLGSIGARHRRSINKSFKALVRATALQITPGSHTENKTQRVEEHADEAEFALSFDLLRRCSEEARTLPLDLVDHRWRRDTSRQITTEIEEISAVIYDRLNLPHRSPPEIVSAEARAQIKRFGGAAALGLIEISAFFITLGGKKKVFIPIDGELSRRAMERHPAPPVGTKPPSGFFHLCPEQPNRMLLMLAVHEMIHALDTYSVAPLSSDSAEGPDQLVVSTRGILRQIGVRSLLDPTDLSSIFTIPPTGVAATHGFTVSLVEGWTQARTIGLLPEIAKAASGWLYPSEEEIGLVYPEQTRFARLLFGEDAELFALAAADDPFAALGPLLRRRFSPRRAEALAYLIEWHQTRDNHLDISPRFDEVATGPLPKPPPPATPEWIELDHSFRDGAISPERLEAWLHDGPHGEISIEAAWRSVVDEYRDQWRSDKSHYDSVYRAIGAIHALYALGLAEDALTLARDLAERAGPAEQAEALIAAGRVDLAETLVRSLPLDETDAPVGSYSHLSNSLHRAQAFAAMGRFEEAAAGLERELERAEHAAEKSFDLVEGHQRGIRLYRYRASLQRA